MLVSLRKTKAMTGRGASDAPCGPLSSLPKQYGEEQAQWFLDRRMVPRGSASLRLQRNALLVGIVVGIAIGGFVLVDPGVHTYCALGSRIATTTLATPVAVVNSPYEGRSSLNLSGLGPHYSFGSGTLEMTSDPWFPFPGASGGDFEPSENGSEPWGLNTTVTWTIYSVENVTGISVSGPCTQAYVAAAEVLPYSGFNYPAYLFRMTLPNATTDLGEPTTIPGAPSVQFFNGYNPQFQNETGPEGPPYWAGLGDCSAPRSFPIFAQGTLRVPIAVPFSYQGRSLESSGFLNWSGAAGFPAAVYIVPDLAGNWYFTSVGAPFSQPPASSLPPAGLLSFAYLPCLPV